MKKPSEPLASTSLREEYEAFLASSGPECHDRTLPKIHEQVSHDLNPSVKNIALKLGAIHLAVGTGSLAFCPQFGLSLSSSHAPGAHRLDHLFMSFGETGCAIACGAFFLGLSLLAAALFLRPEEIRAFRKNWALQISLLGSSSFAVFICFGQVAFNGFALWWFFGALLGGLGFFEGSWRVRKWLRYSAAVTD